MAESVLRFRVETKDANRQVAALRAQVERLEVAVKGAGGSTRAAGAGFKAFSGGAQAAAVGARGLGAALSTALGPLVAVTTAAASLGQVFGVLRQQDFSEAKVRSLGVNSDELRGRLSEVSRELSGQASVLDLTAAAYDVASAGFNDAASASKILKAASQGATGGFSDINTVADATTSVLNAYGKTSADAAKLVDGFIQTQNDGKIVIGEYAANIAKVAPVAAALGVPLEEVNAAVAQITAGGQGAEVTFTALKTAFAQVAAGKVGQEFKQFGVEINSATLQSDGLAGTLQKIKDSGADAGTVIKAFGTEAGPSILALLNDTEKFNQLLENQVNAQGAAKKAAFEASNTIDGQLKRLTTAFQNLFTDQSELGVVIKETFKVAAVTVETLTAAVKLAAAPFRAIFAAVGEIGSAIGQALGVESLDIAFQLEEGFQRFLGVLNTISQVAIGVGKVIGKAIGGVIVTVINLTKGLRTTIIEGIGGLIMTIPRLLGRLYDMLPDFAKGLIDRVLGKGKAMVMSLAEMGGGITSDITQPTGDIANAVQQTGGVLGGGTKPKTKEQTDAEKARADQLAQKDKLLQQLERQFQLETAVDDKKRRQLELDFKIADLKTQFPKLTEDELKPLKERLQINHDTVESKIRQEALDKKAQENADKLKAQYEQLDTAFNDGIVNSIMAAVDGTKSLGDSLLGVIKSMAKLILQQQLYNALSGFSFTRFFGFRANGGPVSAGSPYMVGERGPEMFVPSGSGKIVPNDQLGGGTSVVVNVDASGSSVQGDEGSSRQLGALIGAAVQGEIIKQQRPGGLLSR